MILAIRFATTEAFAVTILDLAMLCSSRLVSPSAWHAAVKGSSHTPSVHFLVAVLSLGVGQDETAVAPEEVAAHSM